MEKDISKKRTPPISVRFSDVQKAELQRRADKAGLSISGYIKFTALDQPQRTLRQPSVDRVLLAKVLCHLGRIGNNLNQISRSLNMGNSIDLIELQHALVDHHDMHLMVMVSLGYREKSLRQEYHDNTYSRDY